MKLLITGASGFLGSALTLRMLELGHEVALLLRPTSRLDRLGGADARCELGRCETDAERSRFVAQVQPDVVIHTACAQGRSGESVLQLSDANLRLGLGILQALLDARRPATFINSATALAPDLNFYSLSKSQLADCGRLLATQSAGLLRFVNVRLQHMYGPGDDRSKFLTYVMHTCHANEPGLKLTRGEQHRDFIYVADAVSAYGKLVERHAQLPPVVDIDLGSGVAPSIREVVETVHRLTGSRTELQFGALPYRANEAMHLQADIAQLQALGWAPEYSLEQGLAQTLHREFGSSQADRRA